MTDIFGVWTPATVLAAIVGGLGLGFVVVGAIIRNPYFSSGLATPIANGLLAGAAAAIGGVVFYVGQVLGARADGDALWPRILSRFALWIVYSVCLGIGAWFAARRDRYLRAEAAKQRAIAERLAAVGRKGHP